jgi:hypothetical protein
MADALTVVHGGRVAGHVTRTSTRAAPTFGYDDDYVVGGRIPLSTTPSDWS